MHWRKTLCSLEDRRQHQAIFLCSFHLQTFPDWCITIKLQCIFQPEWVYLWCIVKLSIFCSPNQQNDEDSSVEFTLITLGLANCCKLLWWCKLGRNSFLTCPSIFNWLRERCQAVFYLYTCSFTFIHTVREAVSSISDLDECQHVEKHTEKSSFIHCIIWQLIVST